jgi:beta-glucosidase
MFKSILFLSVFLTATLISYSQVASNMEPSKVVTLSSKPASADMIWEGKERIQISEENNTSFVSNVSQPSLSVYLPESSKANGTALIIAPGGGFHFLSMKNEGSQLAAWCVENGIAAFVLKYRLVPTGENPMAEFGQKLQNGQEQMDREMAPYISLANADGLAAIEYVRNNAAEFNVTKDQIGIIGFSAGGTVAAAAGLEYTSEENRPDFFAPIYGALHVLNLQRIPLKPMPLFLAVASDDSFGFQTQSIELYKTWNNSKLPAELHIYEKGSHGFGMRKQNLPSDDWITDFKSWITDHGWIRNYRDLNHNGKKDIYEDPTEPIEKRIENLIGQMTIEEKAGLMFNAIWVNMDIGDSLINQVHINNWSLPDLPTAKAYQDHQNSLQKIAENTRLGIPITFYSDPRHSLAGNSASGDNRFHSRWPSELGFGAINDPELTREFADISRQEYLALGIRLALHPQADLATEPRWFRSYTTFGEDADISARLTKAYVAGFQGDELNSESILTMTKHFPGGGPQKDGMDSHFATGKEQVYPGGMFDYHLKPFTEGALPAGTAQLMLYYGQPIGVTEEEVAFGFNKEIVTDLLRDSLGFEGVVCTDWALIFDNPAKPASAWGVEDLSPKERVKKVIDAGVDMFGGESCASLVVDLVKEGSITEARIDESIRRILRDKFIIGLFDDPYVYEEDLEVFNNKTYQEKGREAQRKSLVLLKNEEDVLPLKQKIKVFASGIKPEALEAYANLVDDPEDADFIILKFGTPYTPVENPEFFLQRIFHEGRLDFPEEEKTEMLKLINTKPTISIFTMNRPAVIPEINQASRALIVDFDVEDEILAELIFGKFSPSGKLPVEIPSSVEAVNNQFEDVPHDSKNPLYPFGFGLKYKQ